ncbi:MAG: hypothetical protein TEF_08370 [Rhizobiales bacterium NRL2]|jgi:hypothetical protein|nr:MAG: hypothetical protein TEF_08370 [Rhizobiales bacterium NRL2]
MAPEGPARQVLEHTDRDIAPAEVATAYRGGRRSIAYVELVLLVALLVGLDFLFMPVDGFAEVNPNPYWIPIILLAVQYGVFEGLIAAVVCTAVSLLSGVDPEFYRIALEQGPAAAMDQSVGGGFATFSDEDYFIAWSYAAQPIMWVLAALFIGLLRERLRQRNQELAHDLAQTSHREEVLSSAYNQLLNTKEQLEIRVAGQLRTVFTLYQAAKAIEKLGPGEVLIGIADLVRAVMQPTKFSLYLLNGNVLEAVINDGWEDDDAYARVFDSGSPVFQQVVGRRRCLSAVNTDEEKLLAGEGIMAGPLTSVDTGEVVGMLKIEKLGFLDLHISSLENFRILSDWVGTAFANARRFRKAQSNMLFNEERNMFTDVVFKSHSKLMRQFGERFGIDMTAVTLKAEGLDVLHPERRAGLVKAVHDVVEHHMSPVVQAYEYRQNGREFALILPGVDPETMGEEASAGLVRAVLHYLRVAGLDDVRVTAKVMPIHRVPREAADENRRAEGA